MFLFINITLMIIIYPFCLKIDKFVAGGFLYFFIRQTKRFSENIKKHFIIPFCLSKNGIETLDYICFSTDTQDHFRV